MNAAGRKLPHIRFLVPVCLMLATGLAAAQAYKWTDENGKVHFSDTPPPDRKAETLNIKPATPVDPAAASRRRDWQAQIEESGMRNLRAQQQKDADDRKARTTENNCLRARRQLDTLTSGGAVYDIDKSGQRRYLDDKERSAEIKAARERADRFCR